VSDAGRAHRRSNVGIVTPENTLRKIALRDERFIESLSRVSGGGVELDQRTCELVKLATLIGIDGSLPSYIATVQAAEAAGASETEIVDTLVAVLMSAGSVRTSSAATKIALALGVEPNGVLDEDELEGAEAPR
jgi:alkylhydroperoxidase/carboxymuconolactone decarboxylase family protein YurZ